VSVVTGSVGGGDVTGGAVVGAGVERAVVVPRERGVVAVVVVSVVAVEVPYAPLYWYWPRHDVHTGSVCAGRNGTSGRLPIAVSM